MARPRRDLEASAAGVDAASSAPGAESLLDAFKRGRFTPAYYKALLQVFRDGMQRRGEPLPPEYLDIDGYVDALVREYPSSARDLKARGQRLLRDPAKHAWIFDPKVVSDDAVR